MDLRAVEVRQNLSSPERIPAYFDATQANPAMAYTNLSWLRAKERPLQTFCSI